MPSRVFLCFFANLFNNLRDNRILSAGAADGNALGHSVQWVTPALIFLRHEARTDRLLSSSLDSAACPDCGLSCRGSCCGVTCAGWVVGVRVGLLWPMRPVLGRLNTCRRGLGLRLRNRVTMVTRTHAVTEVFPPPLHPARTSAA